MKKWYEEDWEFTIRVSNDDCKKCRLGLEKGDEFKCEYEAPCGFCSKTMPILYFYVKLLGVVEIIIWEDQKCHMR